jgi:glucan 1,3-beta-glucosidase
MEEVEKIDLEEGSEYFDHPLLKKIKKECSSNILTFLLLISIVIVFFVSLAIYFVFWKPTEIQKIRGVNLGGWFVLEPWITPSLFEIQANGTIVDEFTFCKVHGHEKAQKLLENHWKSWVTEEEIIQLSSMGINHVRIPVGYWMFEVENPTEPWVSGSLPYLISALNWIKNAGIKVILDLHGAPGSQNGFDNSGKKGSIDWPCCDGKNIQRTIRVLNTMVKQFSTKEYHDTIVGINLVNEPFLTDMKLLKPFYKDAYLKIHEISENPRLSITISDAFYNLNSWENFMNPPEYNNIFLDMIMVC